MRLQHFFDSRNGGSNLRRKSVVCVIQSARAVAAADQRSPSVQPGVRGAGGQDGQNDLGCNSQRTGLPERHTKRQAATGVKQDKQRDMMSMITFNDGNLPRFDQAASWSGGDPPRGT